MKLSIRYDLAFHDALLRFADDQINADSNSDDSAPSLRQEQQANQSMMTLCDMIDLYCDRRVQAVRDAMAASLKASEENTGEEQAVN